MEDFLYILLCFFVGLFSFFIGIFGFCQIVGSIKYHNTFTTAKIITTLFLWTLILVFAAIIVSVWLPQYALAWYVGYIVSFLLSFTVKPDNFSDDNYIPQFTENFEEEEEKPNNSAVDDFVYDILTDKDPTRLKEFLLELDDKGRTFFINYIRKFFKHLKSKFSNSDFFPKEITEMENRFNRVIKEISVPKKNVISSANCENIKKGIYSYDQEIVLGTIMIKYHKNISKIFSSLNKIPSNLKTELLPLLYIIADYSIFSLNSHKNASDRKFLSDVFWKHVNPIADCDDIFDSRIELYSDIIRGKKPYFDWFIGNKIPDNWNGMLNCLAAFGDILFNPGRAIDYDSAPKYVSDFSYAAEFSTTILELVEVSVNYHNDVYTFYENLYK